jgi:hypothetical protein
MSAFDRYGRLPIELPDLLTEIAAPTTPDYTDDVLAVTAATRQRPRWTFPERWLPMGLIATERVPVRAPIPWRAVAGVALIILALIAAGLLAAGGSHRPPPPFGVARNGAILLGDGHDISIRDAVDGTTRPLITGPTDDFGANFTRDGTHIVWLRRVSGTADGGDERLAFFMADPDGSNARQVSTGLEAPNGWSISADGSMIVAQTGDPSMGQLLVAIDLAGKAGTKVIDVRDSAMTMSWPDFIGPTGAEIVFRGRTNTSDGVRAGIFAVHPDGSGLRPLTETDGLIDGAYQQPSVSPDGRLLTYTWWDPVTRLDAVHVVDLKSGEDRVLDPGIDRNQAFAGFSPDSRYVTFQVYDGTVESVWVEPVDVPGPARRISPDYPMVDGAYLSARFSPDGRSIITVDEGSNETRLVDVETGVGRIVDWKPADSGAWQRLGR